MGPGRRTDRKRAVDSGDERDGYFDESVAATYGRGFRRKVRPCDLEPAVDFLTEFAGSGSALEFAIGTGRIALPLAERGVPVHGIDLSTAMVERLRAKPGGDGIDVTIGDFATTPVDGSFSLVYLVYNTIGNLTTQEGPGRVLPQRGRAPRTRRRLRDRGGHAGAPTAPARRAGNVFRMDEDRWGIDEYDVATQGLISHHFWVQEGRAEHFSMPFRYVWPSELDLMAQLAGMTLRERWAGSTREPFTSESRSHVSVWEKPTN